jgi:hypothetical protein
LIVEKNKSCFGNFSDPKSVYWWMFEVVLAKRGRSRWWWRVQDLSGKLVMTGWENSRPEAKYQGERALFLLLMATGRNYDPPQAP